MNLGLIEQRVALKLLKHEIAIKLTKYAVQTRYPSVYDDITKEDYEESIIIAKECIEWVENIIRKKIVCKSRASPPKKAGPLGSRLVNT